MFLNKMKDKTGLGDELMKIREAVGMSKDEVKGKSVGTKIFMPSKEGLSQVRIGYKSGVSSISSKYEQVLQAMGLYTNYLANNTAITEIVVSQGARTAEEQAYFVYRDAIKYPNINDSNAMYTKEVGKLARNAIVEGKTEEEVKKTIVDYVKVNSSRFKYVSNNGNTIDIAAGSSRQTRNSSFKASYKHFKNQDKLISSSNSLSLGEGGETKAYHTVFR